MVSWPMDIDEIGFDVVILRYPVAYNILLLPEIIVSLSKASSIDVPFAASVFASSTAALLGEWFVIVRNLHL